jgi:hypothetical protein
LPEGFTATVAETPEGWGYFIREPGGDIYRQASSFGDLVAGANELNTIAGASNALYDPTSNTFIDRRSGQAVTMDTVQNQPTFQDTATIGGQTFAIPAPGEEVPGLQDLAYGLMGAGIETPEQQVAGFSPDQLRAFELARSGLGSYQPFLERAEGLTNEGVRALQQARRATLDLAGQIPGEIQAGQQSLETAAANVLQAAQSSDPAVRLAARELMTSSDRIGQLATRTEQRLLDAGVRAEDIATAAAANARALAAPLESRLGETTMGARGLAERGVAGADVAAQRARRSTATAQQSLEEAAQLGRGTALRGIEQLAGTGAMFSPEQTADFMGEYEDAAVQQALRDIGRQGQLQQQEVAARAVQAGAFGGSRQAVAETELARNVLEQQGRTAAQMRAAGFESASQRAQEAFERAQGRQQNVAQLTGQLGQIGVGASTQAAQAAGQLGLGAEELAQRGALQGAQLGLSAEQFAAANAQAVAQTGLSIEQLAAQTGMSAQQLAGDFAARAGQLGLSAEQARQAAAAQQAQLAMAQATQGMQGAMSAGNLGLQGAQLGLSGIQAGLGAQQQAAGMGQGIAGLGQQFLGLGQATQQMGLQDVNTMLTTGGAQQRLSQAELDALYANQYQRAMQPFQQLAYASDIITGAPSGQISTMSQPGPSIGSQFLGIGLAVPSIVSGYNALTR